VKGIFDQNKNTPYLCSEKGHRTEIKQVKAVSVGIKNLRAPGVPIEVLRELVKVKIAWIESTL
jgi:hypothetical protein